MDQDHCIPYNTEKGSLPQSVRSLKYRRRDKQWAERDRGGLAGSELVLASVAGGGLHKQETQLNFRADSGPEGGIL